MAVTCSICKWRVNKKLSRSFHKFPKDENDKKQWMQIVGKINNGHFGARPLVCSIHFTKDCFRYGSVEKRAFLKQGSLPTLYLTPESQETINKSIVSSKSPQIESVSSQTPEIESVSSANTIKFCNCGLSNPTGEACLCNDETNVESIHIVIEDPSTNKVCLEQPIEGIREYEEKLKEKNIEILSLKQINGRLRKNKLSMQIYMSDMKAEMRQLKKEYKRQKQMLLILQRHNIRLRKYKLNMKVHMSEMEARMRRLQMKHETQKRMMSRMGPKSRAKIFR